MEWRTARKIGGKLGLRSTYMGLRVGEARALEGPAYRDGYLTISQAPVDNRTEAPMKGVEQRV